MRPAREQPGIRDVRLLLDALLKELADANSFLKNEI